MRGTATAAAVLACLAASAACAAHAPEPAKRPRVTDAPRPATALGALGGPPRSLIVDLPQPSPTPTRAPRPKRGPRPVPAYLIEPPAWMFELRTIADDVQLVEVHPSATPRAIAPQPPLIPTAPRIVVGGDALSLAETALARGDAFDAAAQFRSLLARAPRDAQPYLEVQLGRAYVALGRLDDADALLRKRLYVGGDAAWPAVFELATLHVVHRAADPSDELEALAPYALPLREDLARYLMQLTTSPEEIAQLRGLVAPPTPPALVKACADELAAFEAKPRDGLPGWTFCPMVTTSPSPLGHSVVERQQLLRIASEARRWTVLFRQAPDTERWLNRAHHMGYIVALDPDAPAAVLASWLALVAYQNAANTAAYKHEPFEVSHEYYAYAHAQIDRLHPRYREDVRQIANRLFVP